MRVALAPALAIGAMARMGLTHPPAGAAAVIFSAGGAMPESVGWMFLVLPLLVGNTICILVATAWNNLKTTRQYPSYWRLADKVW